MNVLVIEPEGELGVVVVQRLVAEGDDVGVLIPEADDSWKELGAYVAVGGADDADLIERAAQHVRSIVLFDPDEADVTATIEGARMAGTPPARIIVCTEAGDPGTEAVLSESGLEYVELRLPVARRKLLGRARAGLDPHDVAAAVSAADDLAGDARMSIDLDTEEGRRRLGLG